MYRKIGEKFKINTNYFFYLIFSFLILISYSRGYNSELSKWGEPYWVINYNDGLLRRALIGEIFSWFYNQKNLPSLRPAIITIHLTACFIFAIILLIWVQIQIRYENSIFLISVFVLFIGSQFFPRLAHDTGYLDVYVYGLVLAAIIFAIVQLWLPIILIGIVGPFINEGFLFVWMTFSVMLLYNKMTLNRFLVCLSPSVSAIILYFFSSENAALNQMATSPLMPDVKAMMLEYQFGHTLQRTTYIMQWKFRHHFNNFLVAAVFYLYPSAFICTLFSFASRDFKASLALVLSSFAPLTILIFGWDLSRFLLISPFSSLISVLYLQTFISIRRVGFWIISVCWISASFSFFTPHVYAFFNVAGLSDRGILPLSESLLGQAINKITYWYSWGSDAFHPDPQSVVSDPPGNVWHVEEEAWVDIWTRRLGTNTFDVEASLGLAKLHFQVSVVQIGNIIRVSRRMDDGSEMIYNGRLSGKTINGRYPGGVWTARID